MKLYAHFTGNADYEIAVASSSALLNDLRTLAAKHGVEDFLLLAHTNSDQVRVLLEGHPERLVECVATAMQDFKPACIIEMGVAASKQDAPKRKKAHHAD